MSDISERLAQLPSLLVEDPPPPEEIRERARQRRRHRRVLVAVPAVAAAVLLGVAAVLIGSRHEPHAVTAERPATSTTTTVAATLPASLAPSGLTVSPVLDLEDGDRVTVTFDDPAEGDGAVFVAVCAGEVVDQAYSGSVDTEGLLAWCGAPVMEPVEPVELAVDRQLSTPAGTVDCAANVGRCVVAAGLDATSGAAMRWSPVGFETVRQEELVFEATSTAVDDGEVITITGDAGLPGQAVTISQCISDQVWPEGRIEDCDAIRGLEVPVGDDGRFETEFVVFRDILTYSPDGSAPSRWIGCEPCFLVAARSNGEGNRATTPISVAATAEPIHPRVEILEPSPLPAGERVTLTGTGFQTTGGWPLRILVCPSALDGSFDGGCSPGSVEVTPAEDGTFSVIYELPPIDFFTANGTPCRVAGACSLGATPSEGLAYLLSSPLDLRG